MTQDVCGKLLSESDIEKYYSDCFEINGIRNDILKAKQDFELIKKAYHNMIISDNPKTKRFLEAFRAFKNSFKEDSLNRLALVPYITKNDKDIFKDIEYSQEKQNKYREYRNKYYKEIEIYKFTKFLKDLF